jgi:hypothetical protein
MGFMSSWEKFTKWLWDNKASKLQSFADQIREWKVPDWAREIISKLDKVIMTAGSMAFLKKFATEVCKQFDEDYAKKLIEAVVGVIEEE